MQFVDILGVTVVVTALPSMLAGPHAPASAAPLVVTGHAMLFGGLLMLGARLGARFGRRRVLMCGPAIAANRASPTEPARTARATRARSPGRDGARIARKPRITHRTGLRRTGGPRSVTRP